MKKNINLMCKIFGHRFNTVNIAAAATCKKCGYKRLAVVWPRPPVCPPQISCFVGWQPIVEDGCMAKPPVSE